MAENSFSSTEDAPVRALPLWLERTFVLSLCFGYFVVRSAYALITKQATIEYDQAATWHTLLFELLVGAVALLFLHAQRRNLSMFKVRLSWDSLLIGCLAGVGCCFALALLAGAVNLVLPAFLQVGVRVVRNTAAFPLTLIFLIVNSCFEEIFANAYSVTTFASYGAVRALLLSASIRALYHTYQGIGGAVAVFVLGVLFAAIFMRSRNLAVPIIAHTVINIIAVAFRHAG